jgi:flavin reductase (DIM6/NTAB) family NADH-FMN oxidoreductase RutF
MSEYLTITPGELKTRFLHRYMLGAIGPRPIAFASTISSDGTPNLAPFSFFNVFSANPPTLIFSPARRVRNNTTKDTLSNVYEVPEVVVNVVSHAIVEQMNLASSDYPTGVNEFLKAGFTPLESELVAPFRVAESPAQFECKVVEIKPLGEHGGAGQLIFARVVRLHINKEVIGETGFIDPHKIDLVGRMGDAYYSRASGDAVFEVEKPLAQPGIGIDALPEHIRNSHSLTGNELGRLGNMPALPEKEAVRAWWEDNGRRYEGQDLFRAARELLAADRKQDALLLLMHPLLTGEA